MIGMAMDAMQVKSAKRELKQHTNSVTQYLPPCADYWTRMSDVSYGVLCRSRR